VTDEGPTRVEDRILFAVDGDPVPGSGTESGSSETTEAAEAASLKDLSQLRGWDSNPQPSG
jgi:hypothetical protein